MGIGYANLGVLLMAQGLPYDSEAGPGLAGAITALLTGTDTPPRRARRRAWVPSPAIHENAEPMLDVLRMHREKRRIDEDLVPPELFSAAQEAWDQAVEMAEMYGVRNSQATFWHRRELLDC